MCGPYGLLFLCCLSVLSAGEPVSTPDAVPQLKLLQNWLEKIESGLKESERAESAATSCDGLSHGKLNASDWARVQCADAAGLHCQPMLVVRQDVQRFGHFKYVATQDDVDGILPGLQGTIHAERLELSQKGRQLQQMIDFLEGSPGAEIFSEVEVQEQVARAQSAAASVSGKVDVFLALPSMEGDAVFNSNGSCLVASLIKPLSMYSATKTAADNTLDSHGGPIMSTANFSQVLARETSLYMDSFTMDNNRWAANNQLLTYIWLYAVALWQTMVPCFGSGPFMPEASCYSSSVGFLPWWNMFGPEVSSASPLGIVFETVNPGAALWCRCSEFGLLTFSPRPSARSSCWMIPGIGQFGQIIPGRMLPDRTVFGSHPLGCSNIAGRPSAPLHPYEMYIAPSGQAYDPALVELLYALAAGNGSFSKATFYTTSLTQLAILGWYPQSTALQHHGVQFTLKHGSPGMTTKRMHQSQEARVLTMEMVSEGLLWSLREQELPIEELHSTEAYEFDSIPAEIIADYVLDQKGTTYRDANCQSYAKNLMDRVLLHGHGLTSTQPIIGTRSPFTYRLAVLIVVAVLAIVASLAAQWAFLYRAGIHIWSKGAKWWYLASLQEIARALCDDIYAWEHRMAIIFGERTACRTRQVAVAALMLQSPPVFWYVVVTCLRSEKGSSKVSTQEQKAPLLAGT